MGSIHTDASFRVAASKGARAAIDRETWEELMAMSKRELAEIAIHLAALATGYYDQAVSGGDDEVISALERVREERDALRANGAI